MRRRMHDVIGLIAADDNTSRIRSRLRDSAKPITLNIRPKRRRDIEVKKPTTKMSRRTTGGIVLI